MVFQYCTQQMEATARSIYLPLFLSLERNSYELGEKSTYKNDFSLAHPVTSDGLFVGAGLSDIAG